MARRKKESEPTPAQVHHYRTDNYSTVVYLSGSTDTYGGRATIIDVRHKINGFTEYHNLTIDSFGRAIKTHSFKIVPGQGRIPLVAPDYKQTLKLALQAIPTSSR